MDDNPTDKYGTAICPKCGVDSVIGECTGYPITEEFLDDMYSFWMTGNDDSEDEEDIEISLAALEHRFPRLGARSSPVKQEVLGHK
jgi:hypothetical protein